MYFVLISNQDHELTGAKALYFYYIMTIGVTTNMTTNVTSNVTINMTTNVKINVTTNMTIKCGDNMTTNLRGSVDKIFWAFLADWVC